MSLRHPDPSDDVDELIRTYQRENLERLMRILIPMVTRRGLSREDAFELFNDGMLALTRYARLREPVDKPDHVVIKAALNRAISILRRKMTFMEIADSDLLGQLDPVDTTENVVLEADVEQGLQMLPLRCRQAVWLCDIAQLTYGEAAEIMGIAPRSVETNRFRGRTQLRVIMEQMGYKPRPRREGQ